MQAHGSDMVKTIQTSTDWSLENFMLTLTASKKPSLQQYRFSPYAESRLLSACVVFGDGFGGYRDRAREYSLFGGLIVRIMKSTGLPNRVSVYPR